MIHFSSSLLKMGNKGEKTGWIYILVPDEIANELKPNNRKSFKVRGEIDKVKIEDVPVLPVVEIGFILPVNAATRKQLNKKEGELVELKIEEMIDVEKLSVFLIEKLSRNEDAKIFFSSLSVEQQNNFSNWVKSAKADVVVDKRTDTIIKACNLKMDYGQMMKAKKEGMLN
jgi:Domain of unknown function (DUF1905)